MRTKTMPSVWLSWGCYSFNGVLRVLSEIMPAPQSLPTLLLFRDGRAVDRIEGLLPEASLAQRLRFYIGRLDLKFGRR